MSATDDEDGFTTSDAELDSEVESDLELENDLGSWLDQLDSGTIKQNGVSPRPTLKQPVTITPKQVMDSFRCSVLEGGAGQDVDLDAILGELCELETQLTTQQTEINDSLVQSHKNPPSNNNYQDVPASQVRQQRHRTASESSAASSSGAHAQEPLNASWDTDIHSQLQNALSELTDLCGSSEPTDQTETAVNGAYPSVGVTGQGQGQGQGHGDLGSRRGQTGLRTQTSFSSGTKPIVSAKPKVTPPKPAVLPKPPKQVVVSLPPDTKQPPNGVHNPGLDRLDSEPQSQDYTHEGADADSAFSDTASLPSSGSHVSVTTTGSHHSGCSQGSGGSAGSEGSSGLGTSAGSGMMEQTAQLKAEKVRIAMEKIKDSNLKKLFVRVYSSDGSSKSILVDEQMSVAQVCDMLVVKNHVVPKLTWGVIEVMPDLYMERMMEDHEHLVENLLLWTKDSTNKLMFVERPDKYDIFSHPELYLLSEKDAAGYSECDKQALIEEFFSESNARIPEIEGMMYLKSEGKKAWKRYYFVLRASGLYYNPKGKGKSSKDLVCLQKLDFAEVYLGLGWKKKYKAPTDFCFALKHPQIQKKASKYIKYLCVDDHRTWAQWVTCLRVTKGGNQLLKNFRNGKESLEAWDRRDLPGPNLPDYTAESPPVVGVNSNDNGNVVQNGHAGIAIETTGDVITVTQNSHFDYNEEGIENDENENIPTKMLPTLPVTTRVTKAISQQQPELLKKPPQTLNRMRQSSSVEKVERDMPPPPAPPQASYVGGNETTGAALPPPPSPHVLEALQTEMIARASTARQSLRRVSDAAGSRASKATLERQPSQVRRQSLESQGHNSVPASPVRVPPCPPVVPAVVANSSMASPAPQSPRAFSCPDPMAPPAGIAQAVSHRRTSSGPPSTPPTATKPKVPPPPPPKRSETTRLTSQSDESPHTTPQHRPSVPPPGTPQRKPSLNSFEPPQTPNKPAVPPKIPPQGTVPVQVALPTVNHSVPPTNPTSPVLMKSQLRTSQHRPNVPTINTPTSPIDHVRPYNGSCAPQSQPTSDKPAPVCAPPTPPKPVRPVGAQPNLMADLQRAFAHKHCPAPQGIANTRTPSPPPPPLPREAHCQPCPTDYNSDLPPPPAELLEGLKVKKKPPPTPPKRK